MNDRMGNWKRTALCADIGEAHVGQEVILMGWAQRRRDLGSLIFVWLRDRSGIVQVTFNQESDAAVFEKATSIRSEYVLAVRGTVALRAEKDINAAMKTGKIEVLASELRILNTSETPPFQVDADNVSDEVRLKYRYIDLRTEKMQRALYLKNRVTAVTRRFFESKGFLDIETPILCKSTPEGARDYLVPSRVHHGEFYALPQSPQLFKQLLMVSGYDRYYQIAKCFRDEDLRANRQPEFQQIDLEMSFIDQDDIMAVTEEFIQTLFRDTIGYEIALPLKRMTYDEAMNRYGSDKPDMRFGMPIEDITSAVGGSGFPVFDDAVANGGKVGALVAHNAAGKFTRKELDALAEVVKTFKARGLAWLMMEPNGARSSFNKFLTPDLLQKLTDACALQSGDVLFVVADQKDVVNNAMGALRLNLGERLGLIDHNKHELLWVVDFPLVEYSEEEQRYMAQHHPFTSPLDEDMDLVETDIAAVRTKAYDMVCDGYEIGGGSIRIHDQGLQTRIFAALGISLEQAQDRFGFLLDALKYGAPPHGGLAFGLDRLVMVLGGYDNIRDVVAFPKVQSASCLMSEAPSRVDEKQLRELAIAVHEYE